MVLNYIWISFFLIAFVVSITNYLFFGDATVFQSIIDSTFSASKMAVMDIALPLTGVMTLWLGIMKVGERAGAIHLLARWVGPFFSKLFPEVPKNHPVIGQLLMNFSANMLGLDNAATPLGLKAMNSLQELNPEKETASNAQIMFLMLNTSSLTIIPVSILAQRAILGAQNPTDIFIPILLATACSTLFGLFYVAYKQGINLIDKTLLTGFAIVFGAIAVLILYISRLDQTALSAFSSVFSNFILFTIIISFLVGAMYKKVNAYDAFIDGAKDGFTITIKVIPYLIAMLVGIAVFRASGAMDYVISGLVWGIAYTGLDTDFVAALPTAMMKPLSGSGARAMMIESMTTYGADSFVGRLSCVFQGAADTTFYIVALYFGSVGVRKTRYAIGAGLIADLAGVIAAILICYHFFH